MFKLFLILFFFPCVINSNISTDFGISVKANSIQIDNQGNIYTISDNSICKYNQQLILQSTYYQNFYGNINSVDVSNSFKILVFFNDFNQIVFLNENLSEINKIDLFEIDLTDIQFVCSSNQSGFWIYDNTQSRVFFIDEKLNILKKSKFLGKYVKNKDITNIFEYKNNFYLGILNKGVLVLDNSCNIINFSQFNLTNSFSILNNENLFFLNTTTFEVTNVKILSSEFYIIENHNNAIDYKIYNNKKIILTNDSLKIYSEN